MRRDGLAPGLEVEAALAAEAAWELRDAVASMAGFHMDADSTLDLPIELGGDGSLSTDKVILDAEEHSLEVPAAANPLEDSSERMNRLTVMEKSWILS